MTEVWEGDPTPHRGTRHLSGRPLTSQADPTPYKEDPSPHRGTRHLWGTPHLIGRPNTSQGSRHLIGRISQLIRRPNTFGSEGKASACNAGNSGLIPGLGRSPGEGNSNPLQYSCRENPMDRETW